MKVQKAIQAKANVEEEVKKGKAEYERYAGQRAYMQKKLEEIFKKNQENSVQNYRNQTNRTLSSDFSSKASTTLSSHSKASTSFSSPQPSLQNRPNFSNKSSIDTPGGFFDKDAPMLRDSQSKRLA